MWYDVQVHESLILIHVGKCYTCPPPNKAQSLFTCLQACMCQKSCTPHPFIHPILLLPSKTSYSYVGSTQAFIHRDWVLSNVYCSLKDMGNNHMIKDSTLLYWRIGIIATWWMLLLFLQSGWIGCFSLMSENSNDDGIYKDDQYAKGWDKEPEELYWWARQPIINP